MRTMTGLRRLLSTAAAVALAACSGEARRPPGVARDSGRDTVVAQTTQRRPDSARVPSSARGWVVSFEGVGPLRVGMTREEAGAAMPGGVRWPSGPVEGCDFAFVKGMGEGLRLMVSNGRIARVDVNTPSVPTAAGARVGDLQARIERLYGPGVQIQPHKYEAGRYLIVSAPGDTARRLIFETRGDTVTRFRAGRRPEVDWVEGCS